MDFYIVMKRRGFRIAKRRRCKSRIGLSQKIKKEHTMEWFKKKYDGIILLKKAD